MNFDNLPTRQIRQIRQGDPDYFVTDGFYAAPRAGIEFDPSCPQNIRDIVLTCFSNGYIKLVANVPERELVWEKLQK